MAVQSTMLELGTQAPDFELPDAVSGRTVSLDDFADARALVVMFICNHCPYVRHVRGELAAIAREYQRSEVAFVAINSNDPERYPQDAPPAMREEAETVGYTFPYLFDESQEVAHAFRAACTPDLFVFDSARRLVYRGQLDDSRPGNDVPVTGRDLRAAIDAVLAGRTISADQIASIGCNIKWKPGNEPSYFG
jgi:peroxiredoxin